MYNLYFKKNNKTELIIKTLILVYYIYFGILSLEYSKNPLLILLANFIFAVGSLYIYRVIKTIWFFMMPSLSIALTIWVGYVFKLHILLYLLRYHSSDVNSYINKSHPLEFPLLNTPEIIDRYHFILSIIFLAVILYLYVESKFCDKKKDIIKLNNLGNGLINIRKLNIINYALILLSIFTFLVVLDTGVAFHSGNEDLVVKLPFRLAGIIQTILNLLLPTAFIIVLYYSLVSQKKEIVKRSSISFVLYSIAATILTTSKSYLFVCSFALLFLFVIFYGFRKKTLIFLILGIVAVVFFSAIASFLRVARSIDPNFGIVEVVSLLSNYWDALFEPSSQNNLEISNLGLLLRINGADSLLNVIAWQNNGGKISFLNYFISDNPATLSKYYALNVLGLSENNAFSFPPSLLGYLVILLNYEFFIIIGLIIYFQLWNFTFYLMRKISNIDLVLLLTPLISSIVFFSSEGTLESMHRSIIGLVISTFAIRFFARYFRL
jgi:hypothetical protein